MYIGIFSSDNSTFQTSILSTSNCKINKTKNLNKRKVLKQRNRKEEDIISTLPNVDARLNVKQRKMIHPKKYNRVRIIWHQTSFEAGRKNLSR